MKPQHSQNQLTSHYSTPYYTRYFKTSFLHTRFAKYVDRREPVYSYLKRRFPSKSTKLLDVGCGSGSFLRQVQKEYDCTGIDIAPAALKLARQRAPHAKILNRSVYALNRFKPGQFSIITCFDVLEHVLKVPQVLESLRDLLTPDGVLALAVPNPGSIGVSLKGNHWLNYREPSHLWFYSAAEWSFLLKKAGFTPVKRYLDGLNDPPYIPLLPSALQTALFKIPTQGLALVGFPLLLKLSENILFIAEKTLGFRQNHHQTQSAVNQASPD